MNSNAKKTGSTSQLFSTTATANYNISENLTPDLLEIIEMYKTKKIDKNKILNVYNKNLIPLVCNLPFNKSLVEFPFLFNTQMLTYRIEKFIQHINEDLGYNYTNTMDYFGLKNLIDLYIEKKENNISQTTRQIIYKILDNIKLIENTNRSKLFFL